MLDFHEPKPTYWPKTSVDEFASSIAKAFELEPGADLHPLVESLGGEIVFGWKSLDEFNGGSIVVRSVDDFTIVLSEMTSPKRDRFTIAHELGHLCMHYQPLVEAHGKGVCMRATREKRSGDTDHERAEWEANWFAAGFLMPKATFLRVVNELDDNDLATFFNVSSTAVEIRKKTLGVK